jgi:hypothetical protein
MEAIPLLNCSAGRLSNCASSGSSLLNVIIERWMRLGAEGFPSVQRGASGSSLANRITAFNRRRRLISALLISPHWSPTFDCTALDRNVLYAHNRLGFICNPVRFCIERGLGEVNLYTRIVHQTTPRDFNCDTSSDVMLKDARTSSVCSPRAGGAVRTFPTTVSLLVED